MRKILVLLYNSNTIHSKLFNIFSIGNWSIWSDFYLSRSKSPTAWELIFLAQGECDISIILTLFSINSTLREWLIRQNQLLIKSETDFS